MIFLIVFAVLLLGQASAQAQAPVLAPIGPQGVTEGANLNFATSATDPDLTTPTMTAVNVPANASYIDNGDGTGTFDFNPSFTQAGIFSVTFIASDGALADSEVVTITVTDAGNQAPVLAAIGPRGVAEGVNLNFATSATDPDLTTPTMTAVGLPTNATYIDNLNGTGTFNFNPDFTQASIYNVTFIASDGTMADTEVVAITVTNVDRAPVLAAIGPQGVNEGANLNFIASATDPDGQIPVMTAVGLPTNATYIDNLNGTGTFNFNPDFAQANVYNVTFIATSGVLADSEIVAITVTNVDRTPVLATIGAQGVNEGSNLSFIASATDPDGQIPVMMAENLPLNATYTDHGNGTATFDFNPDFAQAGIYNVRFIASSGALADSEMVTITVTENNRPPVLATIGAHGVNESANLSFIASATDPDGQIPVMTAENLPLNATYTDHGNGTATFDFNPDFTQSGIHNVTFIASDGTMADTEVVAITVTNVDRAPVLATIGPQGVNEGANLNFIASATDPDGQIPVMMAENLPLNATYTDHGNGTATFDFNPDFTQSGIYNVRFIASAGLLADSETVTITVADAGNQPPVLAAIGSRSIDEGATLTFSTSATDPDGTIPAMTAVNVPTNATYIDNGNGTATFSFSPGFTQANVYNVRFIASDGVLADTEVVAITVVNVNRAPVLASIGPRSVNAGSSLTFNTSATDPDGQIPVMTAINLPVHATYIDHVNGSGTFVFVPDMTQSGIYSVTFIASDGSLADSEIVAITVINNANQPPVLDSIGPKTVYEGGVLIFQVHATDEAGFPTLLVSATTMNDHYTFVDGGNGYGTFTYSPDYYDAGVDTVTFFALDSGGASDVERVIITTVDVNRPPHVSRMTDYTILPGDSLKIRIVATDSTDPNGGALYLISLAKPAGAAFTDSTGGKGSLRWKPTIADTGTHNFIVLCLDDESPALSDIDTARITVQRTNQAPVLATIGAKSVDEGNTLSIHLSATDPDGTIPFLYAQGIPTNATLVDSANGRGSFTFRPSFRQSGLYSVKFFASDGNKVDYEVVLIQVVNVPQPPVLSVPADTQSVLEGDSLFFKISVTDADSTIDQLTVDATTIPVNATFVDSLNGRGLFRFKPNFAQAGIYNVRFFATDGVVKDTAVVVIKCISAGNQRPKIVVTPTSVTAKELDSIGIRVTATDADGSYPALTATTPLPFNATFVDSGLGIGRLVWKTRNLQTGTYQIVFYATDSDTAGVVDSFTVPIVLNDFNYSPNQLLYEPITTCNLSNCQRTLNEGATLQFQIYTADPDLTYPLFRLRSYAISGTDTTYSAIPANMTLTDHRNDTASFIFTPDYTQSVGSPYNIMFTARDEVDTTIRVQQSMRITVINVSLPVVLDSIGSLSVLEGGVLDVTVTGRDPDGFPVVLSAIDLPSGATFTALTGQPAGTSKSRFLYSPGFSAAGTYTTIFKVSETVGTTVDSEVVTITVIDAGNQRPVLAAIGAKSVTEGLTLNFNDSATDPDGTIPTMTAVNVPVNATFVNNGNGTGTFSFSPSFAQAGIYSVTFIASDGTLADSEVVAITVINAGNQRPILAAIGAKSVTEGSILNFNDSATDPDGTIPTMRAVSVPLNATFVNNGNGTGTFNFHPSFTQAGTYNVTFIASDGTLADSEVVAITVNEAGNQPPVLAAIGTKSVTEGLTLNFNNSATDPDGTIPTMTAVNVPVNATFVNNGNGTGTFSFHPSFTQAGIHNVTFIASDGALADSEVVAITVIDAGNQRPVLAAIGAKSVTEGLTLSFNDFATDPDGTIPTMTAVNVPVHATFVNNGNGTGTFNFSPDTTQAGVYSVTFIASDGTLADTEIVVITVIDSNNQRPVLAAIGAKSVTEGLTLNFNDFATDPNGTIPTMTAVNVPVNATFVNNGNGTGTFNFNPSFTQASTYNVTFIASDGTLADSEVVTITVNEAGNQRPVLAAIGAKSVTEGLTLDFNDSATDPDGTIPAMTAINVPVNATFVNNDDGTGTFNFNPSFTQAGTYSVTFIASDGTLADSEAVAITVINAGNQRPVLATIGPHGVNEGANLNFIASATDPDGTIPTMTAVNVPVNATFVNNGNGTGTFNFNPSFTQAGIFSVTFIASDGALADTEIVAITVANVDRAPVLTDLDTLMLVGISGEQATLWLRAVDPDGTTPTLSVIGTPRVPYNAVFRDSGNSRGSFIWDPTSTQGDSSYSLRFIASDGLLADTIAVRLKAVAARRGDANNDGSLNVSDVVFLVEYIFGGGAAPATIRNGNADGSGGDAPGSINISDATYLIAYIFSGGPPPPPL